MLTLHWDEIPFVRLLFPFIIGIILAIYTNFAVGSLGYMVPTSFCLLLIIACSKKVQRSYHFRWLFGFGLSAALLLLGYELSYQKTAIHHNNHFSTYLQDSSFVRLKIEKPPIEKKKSYKANISILEVWNGTEKSEVSGKAIAYFRKDSLPLPINYGDVLMVNARFQTIAAAKNPNAFDYRQYLWNLGIYHQVYLNPTDWVVVQKEQGNGLFTKVYQLRLYLLNVIEQHIKGKEEIAIASALLLGYKNLLEREVVQMYSHTGAMHVLAVSGLHVGIIFMVISNLLQFLDQLGRKGVILKVCLILLVIWGFALIAGLPPSVSRAATMFSFFAVGKLLKRPPNFYNILAFSAFLILCINPYMLLQVGFQLSYAAVFTIVALQPVIYRWFTVKNPLLDKAWQITAVSIAAQIGTLPISLYYFHQFPTYFFLSNLVVIPAAGLILQLGLLLFAVSPIASLATWVGGILYHIIYALNYCLGFIQQLPLSKLSGISIYWGEVYLWYLVFIGFILFFWTKKTRPLLGTLAVVSLLLVFRNNQQWQRHQQKQFHVYHLKQGTAIDFIHGQQSILIEDSMLHQNRQQQLEFNVQPNWTKLAITQKNALPLADFNEVPATPLSNQRLLWHYPFAHFEDKRLMVVAGQPPTYEAPTEEVVIDYLILTENAKIDFRYWSNCWLIDQVIITASNSRWRIQKWKKQCTLFGIDCYDISEKGAFTAKL